MTRAITVLLSLLIATPSAAQHSAGSQDHELRENSRLVRSGSATDRFSAAMNLGDLNASAGNVAESRRWWREAREVASAESVRLRNAGHLGQWARFASWEAVAAATLGDREGSLTLFEEALRLLPADAAILGRYAVAELSHGDAGHAADLARSALAHIERAPESGASLLDEAGLRFTLARALMATGSDQLAITSLEEMLELLHSERARSIRDDVQRQEQFAVTGTSRGSTEAWTSLMVKGSTALAGLHASRGDVGQALDHVERALLVRSDHPEALALKARLTGADRDFAMAFDADPFERRLHREYRAALDSGLAIPAPATGTSTADRVRQLISAIHLRQWSRAGALAADLERDHPGNENVLALRADVLSAEGRVAEARTIAQRIRSRSIRESIVAPPAVDTAPVLPETGTALTREDLESIASTLRNPATSVAASALLAARSYSSAGVLTGAATDGDTTTAAGAIARDGFTFRFPGRVRFAGVFDSTPIVIDYTILGADPDGLVVAPHGVRLP